MNITKTVVETNVHYVGRKENGQVYGHYMTLDETLEDADKLDHIEKRTTTFEREIVWCRVDKIKLFHDIVMNFFNKTKEK